MMMQLQQQFRSRFFFMQKNAFFSKFLAPVKRKVDSSGRNYAKKKKKDFELELMRKTK